MFKIVNPTRFTSCTRCNHGAANHLDTGCIVVNFKTNKYCECKVFKYHVSKKD